MLNGFPLPDFGFEDEVPDFSVASHSCQMQHLSPEEWDSLCASQGLIVDQSTPIKCTSNSTVYLAQSPHDGQRWAVKVTDHTQRMAA
jgi:membrane-associated tyrosine/threonine-specific cdc2-inhibitory kinase